MDDHQNLPRTIENLASERGVFRANAYFLVLEAIELAMVSQEVRGHISGEYLLDWIRKMGQERYGVMAGEVFNAWGVNSTLDFGRVVFHLVEDGLLKKQEKDNLIDFLDCYEFDKAFTLKAFQANMAEG
jgi:uncharacterized repeat protein (TIGR04138 family)